MSTELAFVIAVVALIGNAFFVGAEFGLIAARRTNIENLALKGSRSAKITLGAMEHISFMLAGAQLGVTVCSLLLGAVGEPLLAHALEPLFHTLGVPDIWLHPVSFLLALSIMVYLHVVIGEMIPKNIALAGPERTALVLTPILVIMMRGIRPLVIALNGIANACLKAIGIPPQNEVPSAFTRDEVAGFVEESRREGLLSENEKNLLSGVLRFDERTIRTVMLPISQLTTVAATITPAEIEQLAAQTGYSRFPVADTSGLSGYVHLKDILAIPANRYAQPLPPELIRPLASVGERTTLRGALTTMRRSRSHLAHVTTSQNKTLGIIMLEDVLEELVGEIRDSNNTRSKT